MEINDYSSSSTPFLAINITENEMLSSPPASSASPSSSILLRRRRRRRLSISQYRVVALFHYAHLLLFLLKDSPTNVLVQGRRFDLSSSPPAATTTAASSSLTTDKNPKSSAQLTSVKTSIDGKLSSSAAADYESTILSSQSTATLHEQLESLELSSPNDDEVLEFYTQLYDKNNDDQGEDDYNSEEYFDESTSSDVDVNRNNGEESAALEYASGMDDYDDDDNDDNDGIQESFFELESENEKDYEEEKLVEVEEEIDIVTEKEEEEIVVNLEENVEEDDNVEEEEVPWWKDPFVLAEDYYDNEEDDLTSLEAAYKTEVPPVMDKSSTKLETGKITDDYEDESAAADDILLDDSGTNDDKSESLSIEAQRRLAEHSILPSETFTEQPLLSDPSSSSNSKDTNFNAIASAASAAAAISQTQLSSTSFPPKSANSAAVLSIPTAAAALVPQLTRCLKYILFPPDDESIAANDLAVVPPVAAAARIFITIAATQWAVSFLLVPERRRSLFAMFRKGTSNVHNNDAGTDEDSSSNHGLNVDSNMNVSSDFNTTEEQDQGGNHEIEKEIAYDPEEEARVLRQFGLTTVTEATSTPVQVTTSTSSVGDNADADVDAGSTTLADSNIRDSTLSNNSQKQQRRRFMGGLFRRNLTSVTAVSASSNRHTKPKLTKRQQQHQPEKMLRETLEEMNMWKEKCERYEEDHGALEEDYSAVSRKLHESVENLVSTQHTNRYLKKQLRSIHEEAMSAITLERQNSQNQLKNVREAMVDVLERERSLMKAQLLRTSEEFRAMMLKTTITGDESQQQT